MQDLGIDLEIGERIARGQTRDRGRVGGQVDVADIAGDPRRLQRRIVQPLWSRSPVEREADLVFARLNIDL